MDRLVFFDDDADELKAFGEIVRSHYEYLPFHWPKQKPDDILNPPDIVVLDLYLPPCDEDQPPGLPEEKPIRQKLLAEGVARCFSELYPEFASDAKRLLRETMSCLMRGRGLLDAQWKALRQDPQNGIELMKKIERKFKDVPVVFYSRKITPKDVLDVLEAGAVDAIQKGVLNDNDLLNRLDRAPKICRDPRASELKGKGLNVNVTVFPTESP
jgi:DNA-binding NarL/FixJ family response regulator